MSAKDHQDLLDLIVSIARSNSHTEFLCADLSAGSDRPQDRPRSPRPTDPFSPTAPSIPLDGQENTDAPSDREWWAQQNEDQNWIRHWEEMELDDQDPQEWK